ncbi:hypothetical protein CFI00_08650 [Nocardioides sp. S5]|uniref:hypothetical protein n=1 Tax=Nocardioides sp. S5 TaxID=2017486 RepID=UPI001A8C01BA|nr:hypothetical protein [Nocardioides sp. S5]QSR30571.1 hypothetical protein CFI00_08650 [Nocardioides sp. S5]
MRSKIFTCAAVTFAATLVMASPASANSFSATTTGVTASWTDGSNTLTASDTATDGYGAAAQLLRPNGAVETVYALGGAGSSNSASYSITEDAGISIRACRTNGGSIVSCGGWVNGFS